ncbi:MAG: HEPN domain-containing protein [Candidatus Sumerlaeota bacterium]|nr:HEPN domain-containing protein [Candidatus Sumerlaeota bacterium]
MDILKQIDYWQRGSVEDMEIAEELLASRRFRYALFFAHLSLEKMLKAHVIRATSKTPPKIHNLVRLAEMTELEITDEKMEWLRAFNVYQLEGRYPGDTQIIISEETARRDISLAGEIVEWLKAQLSQP